VVQAIEAGAVRWSPKDVYELIDKEVPEPIIKAVAGKCGLFYDGTQQPLHVQAKQARAGAPAETVTVTDANPGAFFEWFASVLGDVEAAEEQVPLPMKKDHETDDQYERRVRAADEERVRLLGPHEGRIQMASFELSLPASVQNKDGCDRPVAALDAASVDFNLFRDVMGTRQTETLIQYTSRSIEKMAFTVTPRSVYAWGRCGSKASRLDVTLKRSAEGAWTSHGDFK